MFVMCVKPDPKHYAPIQTERQFNVNTAGLNADVPLTQRHEKRLFFFLAGKKGKTTEMSVESSP